MYCISRDDPFAYLLFAMFPEDYFWPIQFPVTGSLKMKIGHIVLVLWPEILWLDFPRAIGPFQDR